KFIHHGLASFFAPPPSSRLAGYYLALVSIKGFTCLMPMDLSGLLRRLLTDSHIDFASLKGGA
ncbi:hypothetical protein, partial [Aeromonas allosaccharophila]